MFKGDFLRKNIHDLPKTFVGEQHVYLVVEKTLMQGNEKVGLLQLQDYQDARGVDTIDALKHVRESLAIRSRLR
ncbi:MAG: hypothetical protein COT26_01230 [Candidatus Kerfeldbacteria bacterium CG08_land_8_20_14_0_20_43_14]|uniref:Uncharacterized protein n=1 Tax=Candidatus Kerfeldbacteria bacterium CG08_land_8_20_14_0_20_43_14 TaxID=2014246 RepID=A0A2H0YQR6_9BACT|nr:MAG: hypothetical protein COT26_01230 [Candidatus Kerfeldbacteria bacterium CG08_land_8_20_14_0_20_43_14]